MVVAVYGVAAGADPCRGGPADPLDPVEQFAGGLGVLPHRLVQAAARPVGEQVQLGDAALGGAEEVALALVEVDHRGDQSVGRDRGHGAVDPVLDDGQPVIELQTGDVGRGGIAGLAQPVDHPAGHRIPVGDAGAPPGEYAVAAVRPADETGTDLAALAVGDVLQPGAVAVVDLRHGGRTGQPGGPLPAAGASGH